MFAITAKVSPKFNFCSHLFNICSWNGSVMFLQVAHTKFWPLTWNMYFTNHSVLKINSWCDLQKPQFRLKNLIFLHKLLRGEGEVKEKNSHTAAQEWPKLADTAHVLFSTIASIFNEWLSFHLPHLHEHKTALCVILHPIQSYIFR